jgi:hypothetical protein
MRGVLAAMGLYGVVSLLYFGLPAIDDFGTALVAAEEIEPSAFQWFLAWWPDAILEGRNPLATDFIYAPDTVNMTWVTSIPGLSLALAPVTRLFGPVESFNLVTLAAPVLAGLSAFVLCRYLTGRFWPSIAGGYFFGFSSFMLVALAGIPSHSFTALIPLAAYLVVRRVDGTIARRAFIVLLAAVLAAQFLVSVEVFAMLTVFGGLVGVAAYVLLEDRRAALKRTAPAVVLAYVGAMLVVSPFLSYMLFEPHLDPAHAVPEKFSVDLLSFAVPTGLQSLGAGAFPTLEEKFGGAIPVAEGGGGYAYLGLPLIGILILFGAEGWREPTRRLLLLAAGLLALFSLGPRLFVAGTDVVVLPPGKLLRELPMLEYALPHRFPVFTALVVAVILAIWLATRPRPWKWMVAAAALVFLLPNFGSGWWSATTSTPAFFREDRYEGVLRQDDVVFTVPPVGAPVRWHAESGMPFRLANGYIGRIPDDLIRFYRLVSGTGRLPEDQTQRFLRRRRITVILIAAPPSEHGGWRRRFRFLGAEPQLRDGILMYRLAPPGARPAFTDPEARESPVHGA